MVNGFRLEFDHEDGVQTVRTRGKVSGERAHGEGHQVMVYRKILWLPQIVCIFLVSQTNAQETSWEAYTAMAESAYQQGLYDDAEDSLKAALKEAEQFEAEDPRLATTLTHLAFLYHVQGNYEEAEPLYHRSLTIKEKTLGPEHPTVATSLNNLANLYHAQERYADAEPLYQRSLAIAEKAEGPKHPDVATGLNNLALLYHVMGRYAEAEPLYHRSLAIWEQALGPDHANLATGLENYARLLRAMGREEQAAKLEARAKAIRASHAREDLIK